MDDGEKKHLNVECNFKCL